MLSSKHKSLYPLFFVFFVIFSYSIFVISVISISRIKTYGKIQCVVFFLYAFTIEYINFYYLSDLSNLLISTSKFHGLIKYLFYCLQIPHLFSASYSPPSSLRYKSLPSDSSLFTPPLPTFFFLFFFFFYMSPSFFLFLYIIQAYNKKTVDLVNK